MTFIFSNAFGDSTYQVTRHVEENKKVPTRGRILRSSYELQFELRSELKFDCTLSSNFNLNLRSTLSPSLKCDPKSDLNSALRFDL